MRIHLSTKIQAFTLVELLAAMAVLAMLMAAIFGIFNQTSKAWLLAENRTETFQGARLAMDMISRDLESAIVGTHTNSAGPIPVTSIPFITFKDSGTATIAGNPVGFTPAYSPNLVSTPPNDAIFFVTQAPDSRSGGGYFDLAECGYYVAFATVSGSGSGGMTKGNYYLLRHYVRSNDTGWDLFSNPTGWFATAVSQPDMPLLENAVRLEILYEYATGVAPNGTTFANNWNSYTSWPPPTAPNPAITDPTLQLPRAIHIQLSVLDRRYAARLAAINNNGQISNLSNLPFNIPTTGGTPQERTLREGLRTFFRSVYPRGAS